jgi:hypothetical protein
LFPEDSPKKARADFIKTHGLAKAMNAGGPVMDDHGQDFGGGPAPVDLPDASRTRPFLDGPRGLCRRR